MNWLTLNKDITINLDTISSITWFYNGSARILFAALESGDDLGQLVQASMMLQPADGARLRAYLKLRQVPDLTEEV